MKFVAANAHADSLTRCGKQSSRSKNNSSRRLNIRPFSGFSCNRLKKNMLRINWPILTPSNKALTSNWFFAPFAKQKTYVDPNRMASPQAGHSVCCTQFRLLICVTASQGEHFHVYLGHTDVRHGQFLRCGPREVDYTYTAFRAQVATIVDAYHHRALIGAVDNPH